MYNIRFLRSCNKVLEHLHLEPGSTVVGAGDVAGSKSDVIPVGKTNIT